MASYGMLAVSLWANLIFRTIRIQSEFKNKTDQNDHQPKHPLPSHQATLLIDSSLQQQTTHSQAVVDAKFNCLACLGST
jgi:hypothetical protein